VASPSIGPQAGFPPDRRETIELQDVSASGDASSLRDFPGKTDSSDAEIVAEVRQGQVDRFEELVRRHQPRVFATARRHARLDREVEDIVQEVFVKAYHKLDTWRGEAPFEHWLMRLAVRTCYDHLRSHQRNREDSSGGEQELDLLATSVGSGPAPGISTNAAAAKALVDAVLDRLPPAHRLVLTLLELEERSIREIADLTGWSIPLVKVRAFRARAAFRAQLGRISSSKYL
jgi:RNA polymerase sigma-70 factor (ECF subfamily)